MVALFKDRSPAAIIWLFLLSIVVHSHFFVDFTVIWAPYNSGLISWFLNKYLALLSPAFIIFIYHGVVFLQALRLNYLFTGHRMYSKVNYLPAMTYILLTGFFPEWSYLSPALIDNFMVIWLFSKCIGFYNSPDPKTLLFNSGIIIGISILFYHPSALLIMVALFALITLRSVIITEWLVLFMGVVCPYYFLFAYLYLTDRIKSGADYIPSFQLHVPKVTSIIPFFVSVGVIVLVLVIGIIYWRQENRRLLIQIRKNWVILIAMLFILLPVCFIHKGAGIESLLLWIVPASPLIAAGFLVPKNNFFPTLLFWLLLAVVIVKNWGLIT